MINPDIKTAIDVCRHSHMDVDLAENSSLAETLQVDDELRQLVERVRGCDTLIGRSVQDVAVPEGLEQRLLMAVQGAGTTEARFATCELSPNRESHNRRGPFRTRARIVAVTMGGVAVAILAMIFFQVSQPQGPQPGEPLAAEVMVWAGRVIQSGWSEDAADPLLTSRPLDRAIRGSSRRWSRIATAYDAQTVVYDVAPPGGEAALVFCMKTPTKQAALPAVAPLTPFSTTGGFAIGAWQHGGLVYVLMVEGGQRRYRSYLDSRLKIGMRGAIGAPSSLTGKV